MGITTIGLCDSDNITMNIDWVVPCNNKGRKSLALIFYLLAREYLMGKGKIASYDEFTTPLSAFEAEPSEEGEKAVDAAPAAETAAAAVQEPLEAAPSEAHKEEHKKEHKKKEEAPDEAKTE
jgi:ribosomal protein S2